MTTTLYIRRAGSRPLHLLGADKRTAVCGAVSLADPATGTLAVAPTPLSPAQVCKVCLALVDSSYSDKAQSDEGEVA
jgi:hypothetical protein